MSLLGSRVNSSKCVFFRIANTVLPSITCLFLHQSVGYYLRPTCGDCLDTVCCFWVSVFFQKESHHPYLLLPIKLINHCTRRISMLVGNLTRRCKLASNITQDHNPHMDKVASCAGFTMRIIELRCSGIT